MNNDNDMRPMVLIWLYWQEVIVIEESAELLEPIYVEWKEIEVLKEAA